MPRKMRVEYEGAPFQVMSRGNRREDIFLDDVDRHEFLKTPAEACQKTDWQVHASLDAAVSAQQIRKIMK